MASKAYEVAFKLGAKMDRTYGNTFQKAEQIASKTVGKLMKAAAAIGGVVLGGSVIKDSIDKAIGYESAMADVAKVVDGLKDSAGNATEAYAVMSEEILGMTARLPMAAEDITALISAAGQSGIAANELTRFAEDAAKMGVAFDLPAERAGELAAVIRSSLGITQDEFVVLADKINYFGNTTTQSADKLIEVVEATGLIGKQAGVNADQIAAMGAAMNGMDAANMGTALSNIYGSLMTGAGATTAAKNAWQSLGFTSEQVAKDMLADSEGTMLKVFEAMKKLPQDQLSATTAAIFGNNKSTKMAIAAFTENLGVLEQNFKDIGDATKYAGSMQEEFNTRAATTENKIQLAKNAVDRLKISFGNLALPLVAKGANVFSDAINGITERAPELIKRLKPVADVVIANVADAIPVIMDNLKLVHDYIMHNVVPVFFEMRDKAVSAFLWIKGVAEDTFSNMKKVIMDNAYVFRSIADVALDLKDKLFVAFDYVKPAAEWLFTTALPKVTDGLFKIIGAATEVYKFLDSMGAISETVYGIGIGFSAWKIGSIFLSASKSAVAFGIQLINLPGKLMSVAKAYAALTQAKIADKLETMYLRALYAKDFLVGAAKNIIATTVAWGAHTKALIANKVQMGLQAAGTLALKAAQTIATGVTAAMTAAQWALNAAFVASPIGWIILAVGALIAVGILLYKNWDIVKASAISLWEKLTAVFGSIKDTVSGAIVNIINCIAANFPIITTLIGNSIYAISEMFLGFKTTLNGVIEFIAGVFTGDWERAWLGVQDIFKGIFQSLAGLVKSPLNAVISLINSAIDGINSINFTVPDWVPNIGGQNFGVNIPPIPMLAKGSNYSPETFIAGEKGPELITNAMGSKVFTALETGNIFTNLSIFPDTLYESLSERFGNIFGNTDDSDDNMSILRPVQTYSAYNEAPVNFNVNYEITVNGASAKNDGDLERLLKKVLEDNSKNLRSEFMALLREQKIREMRLSNG